MRLRFFIIFCCIALQMNGQDLFIPYNIKNAYVNGTRDYKGGPGDKYFQNSAKYEIKASFDPIKGILTGKEEIIYKNNSEAELTNLTIRLYQDLLKKGNLRDESLSEKILTDGVQISSLKVNGIEYLEYGTMGIHREGTNLVVYLKDAIAPHDSTHIYIKWKTTIPQTHIHRFGYYGQSNWFIGYWYPQIAVYDDIDQWDMINYTGLYEFYNDFSDYNVSLTVPSGYILWATGDWLNQEEILSVRISNRLSKAYENNDLVHILTSNDWENGGVFKSGKKLNYSFEARNVTDFAFALSNNYLWDAKGCITDSILSKKTVVHAVYPKGAKEFSNIAQIGAEAIRHFSFKSIGIPYPYNKVVVFNGDGGMEYPMMVNQRNADIGQNTFVAMHEIFHGYFPFYTGINERRYAWLDEGLTTYLPMETEELINKNSHFQLPKVIHNYNFNAGMDYESSLMTPSAYTRGEDYYHQAYFRSSVAFAMLEQYLGREQFRDLIREFVYRWNGKHPTGYDFLFTLIDKSDTDITWLIKSWFFEEGWADLAINKVHRFSDKEIKIEVENIGGMPVPIELKVVYADNKIVSKSLKADVWKNGDKEFSVVIECDTNFSKIELGSPFIPDKNMKDNYYFK